MIAEKAVGHGGPVIDYGRESPKYRQLRTAISAYYGDLLVPLEELHHDVLLLAGLQAAADLPEGAFSITTSQRARINAAVERFLVQLAGPDRSREGFVAGGIEADEADGIIQQRNVLTYAVGLQRGARLLDTDTTLTAGRKDPAVTAMLERAFERLSENGQLRLEGVRDEIQGILVGATDAGLNPLDTARQLSGRFNQYSRVEFERLARTEAAFAAEEGNRNQLRDFGVTHIEWVIDVSACVICQGYVGKIIPIEAVDDQPPIHPNCCAEGTVVSGPKGLASTERRYVGEVIDLETRSGNVLTVTPNHPVLTPEGWVAAGLLNEGDKVICEVGGEVPTDGFVNPDDYQIPAPIEEVARSLGGSSPVTATRVPTTAEDFHGDGLGSEVCVVRTNRELRDALNAPLSQPLRHNLFSWRHAEALGLSREGSGAERLVSVALSSAGRVRCLKHLLTPIRRPSRRESGLYVPEVVKVDAVPQEDTLDGSAVGLKVPSEAELRAAGNVAPDDLVFVGRREFEGQVFNLQTNCGWYVANNIITHNCLCSTVPYLGGQARADQ